MIGLHNGLTEFVFILTAVIGAAANIFLIYYKTLPDCEGNSLSCMWDFYNLDTISGVWSAEVFRVSVVMFFLIEIEGRRYGLKFWKRLAFMAVGFFLGTETSLPLFLLMLRSKGICLLLMKLFTISYWIIIEIERACIVGGKRTDPKKYYPIYHLIEKYILSSIAIVFNFLTSLFNKGKANNNNNTNNKNDNNEDVKKDQDETLANGDEKYIKDCGKYKYIGRYSEIYSALFLINCLTWFAFVYRWAHEVIINLIFFNINNNNILK